MTIALVDEVRRRGPIPYSELVEAALYDADEGFYATTGSAGRDHDFITSPELGPLFGAVVARALDGWWRELGEPDPFVVIEGGAGPGTLCRTVLAAEPDCTAALRYVLVERSAAQRARHHDRLPVEDAAQAFGPRAAPDDDEPAPVDLPLGPIVVSLAELPRMEGPCVVIANELLDNLPFDLYERHAGAWLEVRVGLDDEGRLAEVGVPVVDVPAPIVGLEVPDGARVPIQAAAARWVRDARALAGPAGRVLCFDYARRTTAELAARPWRDWLRTYRSHGPGSDPLDRPGRQDITVEVAVDQLPVPSVVSTQADWLRAHGIDELVAEARGAWEERAAVGDLAALRARSRVDEGRALTDPHGPGAFLALEWGPASA